MDFYHHQTLSKITLALLDTLNDVKVRRVGSDGIQIDDYTVPITFGSREKSFVLSEQDSEAMRRGNVNILPRMALDFDSMTPARNRQTNKYTKINKVIGGETISFQYNAVPMDFSFTVHIATRTFSDMSMIMEQLIPFFNPSYSLFVNELEIQEEPTSIPVTMESSDIELPEEYEGDEIRVITGTISLLVKGNLYPPIKEGALVKKVKVYMGLNEDGTELRSSRYQFDVINGQNVNDTKVDFFDTRGENIPVISSVSGNLTLPAGESRFYTVNYSDVDSDNFIYVWSIVQGSGSIGTGRDTVVYISDPTIIVSETVTIRVIVIDELGLQSIPYDFNIEVTV